MILTIRTDKPGAEIGLYDQAGKQLNYITWQAHRHLAETIHDQIAKLLESDNSELKDIDGIVAFKGPGSYTGLRIGMSVANALAYSIGCKVVATNSENWQTAGVTLLSQGKGEEVVLPEYDAPAKTTQPRK